MDTRLSKKYALIPFLYLCVIGALIYMHITQVETFREVISGFTIQGTALKDREDRSFGIRRISISAQGLTWEFGSRTPVMIDTSNGIAYPARLQGYRLIPDGIEVLLNMNVSIFFVDDGKGHISVRPGYSDETMNVETVSIRLFPEDTADISSAEGVPIIRAAYGDSTVFFSVPEDVVMVDGFFVFSFSDGSAGAVVLETSDGTGIDPYTFWFAQDGSLTDPAEYEEAKAAFLESAYYGWDSGRYDSSALAWDDGAGEKRFLPQAFNAYISESYRRGNLSDTTTIRRIVAKYAGALPYSTNPHTGDVVRTGREEAKAAGVEVNVVTALVEARNLDVFKRDDPIEFAMNHGSTELVGRLFELLSNSVPENIDQAVGMLCACLRGIELLPDSMFSETGRNIVEENIFSAMYRIESGIFLENESGICDTVLSIVAGQALMELGRILEESVFSGVGRSLVTSALNLADKNGFLPRKIHLGDSPESFTEERIPPEWIYPLLYQGSYFPREISLNEELGTGTYIWTAAENVKVSREVEEINLEFDFPVGYTHHFIVRGIEPFQRVYMFGIRWNTDPYFQNYSSGWAYDLDTKTLYVKIRHRSERERVVISYANPLPPKPTVSDSIESGALSQPAVGSGDTEAATSGTSAGE